MLAGILALGDRQARVGMQSGKSNGVSMLQCALFVARKAAGDTNASGNESLER